LVWPVQLQLFLRHLDLQQKLSVLKAGPAATVNANLSPGTVKKDFEFGFTRGYASSQGYAAKFQNATIAPQPKNIDYDTSPYLKQYEWLG
jgi:hypothetical protein